jgi:hypothetical protein
LYGKKREKKNPKNPPPPHNCTFMNSASGGDYNRKREIRYREEIRRVGDER